MAELTLLRGIFALAITAPALAAEQGAILAASWEPLCELSAELKKTPKLTQALVDRTTENIEAAQLQAAKLEVYTLKLATTADARGLMPFLYGSKRNIMAAATSTREHLRKAILLQATAATAAGHIDEFADLLLANAQSTSLSCIGTTGNNVIAASTAKPRMAGCTHLPVDTLRASFSEGAPKANKIGLGADSSVQTHTTDTKCILTGTGAATDMFNSGSSHGAGALILAGGTIEITETSTKLKARKPASDCSKPNNAIEATLCLLPDLGAADKETQRQTGNHAVDQIKQNEDFPDYLKQANRDKATSSQTDTTATGANTTASFASNFWELVDDTEIPAEATRTINNRKLRDINSLKELHLAAIYYQTQTWNKLAEQAATIKNLREESEKHGEKLAESACAAAKDSKDDCDKLKNRGCTFNDKAKKCELKKEVKSELENAKQEAGGHDDKTNTSTTGSNSFAINKTPLLFAFLLF
uniref:Variant surface glycoprotein 1125.26 n=1 Tax=Trypanosoma brucei TaxID=5691 RepID=M4SXJ6_9TRYP|nr:variant surface glycoprotein 637 [Trypanosoma brucei]APD72579.1 variant surface glycoprotein 1125.26 [Trypanosoma brucei]